LDLLWLAKLLLTIVKTNPGRSFRLQCIKIKSIVPKRCLFDFLSIFAISAVLLAAPLRAQFVYVTNQSDNTISAYSLGSDGKLTPVAGSPFPTGYQPISLAFDSAAGLLYSGNQSTNSGSTGLAGTVTWFSIDSSGALTPASSAPVVIDSGLDAMTIGPAGKFLYVGTGNPYSGEVDGFSIGSGGALTAIPGSPFKAKRYTGSIAIDPKPSSLT
jgi:DNA-binding beta-propeller fold protein YncE